MGFHKEQLIRAADRKLTPGATDGKYVCADCFDDDALQRVVSKNIGSEVCSFCGAQSDDGIAAPLEVVMEHFSQCILRYYDDAANCLLFESAEGGYQGTTFDRWDLLDEIGIDDYLAEGRDKLKDAIGESLEDTTWCEGDPGALRPHESLSFSWQKFCDFVKHERRFFFLQDTPEYASRRDGDGLIGPAAILRTIVERCIELPLITTLPRGRRFYRARLQKGRALRSALDFGGPPPEKASQNRMSPAGVPMTYLTEDEQTALEETAEPGANEYAIGSFELSTDVSVVDLTRIPPVPSMFDLDQAPHREQIIFLREFVADLSEPIVKDGREHVDYVPTQIVTEFFCVAPELRGKRVLGLRYSSSRRNGGVCLVLFGGQELLEPEDAGSAESPLVDGLNDSTRVRCLRLTGTSSRTFVGEGR
jgi:hypothetical protein